MYKLILVFNKTVLSCVLCGFILIHMESDHSKCLNLILMAGAKLKIMWRREAGVSTGKHRVSGAELE